MGLFWKFPLKGSKLFSLLALPAVRERIPGWVSPSVRVGICCPKETPTCVHSRPQHILGRAVCKNKTGGGGDLQNLDRRPEGLVVSVCTPTGIPVLQGERRGLFAHCVPSSWSKAWGLSPCPVDTWQRCIMHGSQSLV